MDDDGTQVRVICGAYRGKSGPVDGIAADPVYLDVFIPPGREKTLPIDTYQKAFAYIFTGAGNFSNASGLQPVLTEGANPLSRPVPILAADRSLVLFDNGDEVSVQAGEEGIRFLLVSGKPIKEPVAWYGPIVMNTQDELRQAFEELDKGTFLKE
jgi:redox-sensitive bicupin YhaK (pirin superfamily)